MQFFFLARFAFMLLETIQTYAILTNVINDGGFFSLKKNMIFGWIGPAIVTIFTAVTKSKNYVSKWS